jgi:hypothetical protein
MRLRRVSSIVVLSLLSAATAYAECAWVLWPEEGRLDRPASSSGPLSTRVPRRIRARPPSRVKSQGKKSDAEVQGSNAYFVHLTPNVTMIYRYVCPPRHRGPARAERV